MSARPLRVCIDARAMPDSGGVRQALIGLAAGLAELGGEDEYLFLVFEPEQEWLRPYLQTGQPHCGGRAPRHR